MSTIGRQVAGALVVIAAVSGCATGRPVERAAVGHYSTVEAVAPMATEDDFLVTIKGLLSGRAHAEQSDAEYVQGGKDICAEIGGGATWSTLSQQVVEIDGDVAFYRAAVRASVLTFCPARAAALSR